MAATTSQRAGKTALMWHQLELASKTLGRAIVCGWCKKPHTKPPALGRCTCGCYFFVVQDTLQLPLEIERVG